MKKTVDEHGNVWNIKDFYQLQSAMYKLIKSGKIKIKKGGKKR